MKTITTLGPSVRLVVVQFLMKSNLVPAAIPPKRPSAEPPVTPVSGVKVLESTPGLDLFPLAVSLAGSSGNYELVDAWKKPHETKWGMSAVRFVFCYKKHVKQDKLFPEFVAKRDELANIFTDIASANVWATQGHLNPYFEDNKSTGHLVLMLSCAGRVPNTEVFKGGRDENGRGVGPKVQLSTLSPRLDLASGNKVVLATPPTPMVSTPAV